MQILDTRTWDKTILESVHFLMFPWWCFHGAGATKDSAAAYKWSLWDTRQKGQRSEYDVCVWLHEVLSTGKFWGGGGEVRVTTGTHQHNQLGILVYHLSHHAQARGYDKLKFFQETDIYWAPATTTSGLYTQLSEYKYREIPRHQIR